MACTMLRRRNHRDGVASLHSVNPKLKLDELQALTMAHFKHNLPCTGYIERDNGCAQHP
jgi:hypothetical protein